MPFSTNAIGLVNRQIVIEPEYGYGWLLVGTAQEPIQIPVPESFKGTISGVLSDSSVSVAVIARCECEISGCSFCWVGLSPRTDSVIDLAVAGVYCNLILSSVRPYLSQQDMLPEIKYLCAKSKIFVRGSARIEIVQKGF